MSEKEKQKLKKVKKKNSKIKNVRVEHNMMLKNKIIRLKTKKMKKAVISSNKENFNDNFSKFMSIVHKAKKLNVIKNNKVNRLLSRVYKHASLNLI